MWRQQVCVCLPLCGVGRWVAVLGGIDSCVEGQRVSRCWGGRGKYTTPVNEKVSR